ncbi:tripartite motif-containing protein 39 [Cricetulus griseus]|nr:tripartite motif-containing protein 39 [Cricetulus griseus]
MIVTKHDKDDRDLFLLHLQRTHPVSINCGHSYWKSCIQSYYNKVSPKTELKIMLGCPLCRSPFSLENLRPHKELENIIDVIKEMEGKDDEMLCEDHDEKLDLLCEDEGQLLCWSCNWEAWHKGHSVALVEDMYQGYKEKHENTVTKLSELRKDDKFQIHLMTTEINTWKLSSLVSSAFLLIQSSFKNIQNFLHEEEKSYLWRLENEEEQVLRRLKGYEANLQQQYEKIDRNWRQNVRAHPEKYYRLAYTVNRAGYGEGKNGLFVSQGVKNTLSRCEAMNLETLKVDFLKVNMTCNVSELYFDVETLVRHHHVSVTLDPSRAHRDLTLSKDQRQVTYRHYHKKLEASAKRFYVLPCVLGSKEFPSGRYYFEVSIENASTWDMGACTEDVPRGFHMKEPELGYWTIKMCEEDGLVALTSTPTPLCLSEKPQLVEFS